MAGSTNDFLSQEVWPFLNAVEAGFFDELNPTSLMSSGNHKMDCPSCKKKRRAFYFPGGLLICDRKNECGYRSSVFNYLTEYASYSRKDALEACVRAVGKTLPTEGRYEKTAESVFKKVTKDYLYKNEALMELVCADRSLTLEELKSYDLGFFPPLDVLYNAFKEERITFEDAQLLGFLPMPKSSEKKNNAYFLQNRLIGYWKQPSGSFGVWARTIDGIESPGQKDNAKYLFSSGISKSIPYMLRSSMSQWHVAIEGPFDVLALNQLGMNACGIGGACIIDAQAKYIVEHNITRIIHVTDGDFAGLAGGIDSVINCSSVGLDCYVAPLGKYLDDPDDLRAQGKDLITAKIIDSAFRPGVFLAHARHHIYRSFTAAYQLKYVDKIDQALNNLPGHIRADFEESNIVFGYFA